MPRRPVGTTNENIRLRLDQYRWLVVKFYVDPRSLIARGDSVDHVAFVMQNLGFTVWNWCPSLSFWMMTLMNKITLQSLAFCFALVLSVKGGGILLASDGNPKPPNFLFFMADDLNKEYYQCYGGDLGATPAVSRFAKEGMVFDNAFTGQAICTPSRSMLYTGLYPLRNGAFKNHSAVYAGTRSICHYLKDLDYEVVLCGKSHVKPRSAFPWSTAMHSDKPGGSPEIYTKPALPTDQLEDYFAKLRDRKSAPFCIMANSYYPHGEHPRESKFEKESISLTRFHENTVGNRESESRFAQAIKNSDDEFDQVLRLLDKYGLAENTIVFYASDHGRFGKYTPYDRGLRVPFVVRWPGVVKQGSRSGALVSFADVLPTMLKIAGGQPVEGLDGQSFAAVLRGETDSHHEYVYGVMTNQGIINAHVFPGRMIRSKRYKYIRNYNAMEAVERREKTGEPHTAILRMGALQHPDIAEEELFDVLSDPNEERNLAADPAFEAIKVKLRNQLQSWLISQNDFLQNEAAMPLLATEKEYRLDLVSHAKNKVDLPANLLNSLDQHEFYEHRN